MRGWAVTGVGSLGHRDAGAAVQAVLASGLDVPFWPQLPRFDAAEAMVMQGGLGLGFLVPVDAEGSCWRCLPRAELELHVAALRAARENPTVSDSILPAPYAAGMDALERALGARNLMRLKGQWIGPATLGTSLRLDTGKTVAEDAPLFAALLDAVHVAVRRQAQRLLAHAQHVELWLDEPLLGSTAVQETIDPRALPAWYSELARACGPLVRLGVHCCAPPPWDALFALEVPLVSIDAWTFAPDMASQSAALRRRLEVGEVAWGIVPATGLAPPLDTLQATLERILDTVAPNASRAAIGARSHLTTSCGLAGLDAEASTERLRLCVALAQRMRRA